MLTQGPIPTSRVSLSGTGFPRISILTRIPDSYIHVALLGASLFRAWPCRSEGHGLLRIQFSNAENKICKTTKETNYAKIYLSKYSFNVFVISCSITSW